MPNKTKPKATKKASAHKTPARPVKAAKSAKTATRASEKKTHQKAVKAAKPTKAVKPSAAERALARAAAKAAEKAQKKLVKAEKVKMRLEEKIAAKALAKEARLALKRQMREGLGAPATDVPGNKGKGLNLLVAPKGKGKPEKPGRKVKAPKPTRGPQFVAGTVFLPDGFKSREEIQYLFRGAVACVRESLDVAAAEIRAKSERLQPNPSERELLELARIAEERFRGAIEAAPPNRVIPTKRTFASLVERARARRREIGAFMRGLDLGKTEPSHLDTHSEASLQGLMEWGARLEMLADSAEVDKPDFTQQHRVLDQLESTTEMLVVDVELTLRRYKDRMSARGLELSPLPV